MLDCDEIWKSREKSVTVTLLRKSSISLMTQEMQTTEEIRDLLASAAQHKTRTGMKYYDHLDEKGVSFCSYIITVVYSGSYQAFQC